MHEPLISIIMPVYNAARYVAESIESVIAQTWQNKELILIDDASTDNSYEVISRYENDWIKIFQLTENKGQSYASNFGYGKTSGRFIKYLDADDLIDTDYLTTMISRVVSEDDLYFSNCINFQGEFSAGNRQPYDLQAGEKMLPMDFLLNPISNMRQGGRWMIPRPVIEKAGLWNEDLSLINDFEYFTRLCLNSGYIHLVEDANLYYRQLEKSLSGSKKLSAVEFAFQSIRLAGEQLRQKEDSDRVRRYIADSLQALIYTFYPLHRKLADQIELYIDELGGSGRKLDGGKKMLMANKLFGWKATLASRHYAAALRKKLK